MKSIENNPIIICASGNSIPFTNEKGINKKLSNIIENNYSIGLNYWFKYGCETTFNCSVDWQFYYDNFNDIDKIPLIVSSNDAQFFNKTTGKHNIHENTLLLPHCNKYFGEKMWDRGIYTRHLVGIFALSLAIGMGFKEIYLLGYDCKDVYGKTHFYQDLIDINKKSKSSECNLQYRGIGKVGKSYRTSTYNNIHALNEKWFFPFREHRDVNIFNVSPESAIEVFKKIDYRTFYKQIKNNGIDQNEARDKIKNIINEKMS